MTELKSSSGKLKDLLAKRVLRRQTPLSGGSKTLLREAVLQLIDHHQHFDLLIKESRHASSTQTSLDFKTSEFDKDGQLSVSCCISYLRAQAKTTGVPLATLAAKTCVAKISEILIGHQTVATNVFLMPDQQNMIDSILEIISTLKSGHSFDRMQFAKEMNSRGPLPLELLWKLHAKSIMTFDLFITSNLGQHQIFTTFTSNVGKCSLVCVEESDNMLCARILKDIFQFLISNGYTCRSDAQDQLPTVAAVQKACVLLLDSIIESILDSPDDKGPTALARLLEMARSNPSLTPESLTKFFSHLLILVLGHKADITVKDAIGGQEQWSFGRAPSSVTDMYRQLLLAMECNEAVGIVQRVVEREEVNWKSLLTFSATLLVCFQQAPQMLKDLIDTLLNQSLESCEQDGLIAAFLLARQAANEGPHVFPSYMQWFRDHFGDGSNSLTNKKTVAFFLAFLTSLVPHEPAGYLKVHVKNQPHLPPKCRESLSDYVYLAKTRLADLKVPLEPEGIYNSTTSNSPDMKQTAKIQMQDQAMEDVEKAVAAFDKTSKLPTNVIEASIFKRPYFIGRFLPALLKPRLLPDIQDCTMKFIEELKCSDKIPAAMLQQYEEACAKEASSLLEGAFTDDVFDDCLEPMDALNVSLEKLPVVVVKHLQLSTHDGVAQHMSIISDRLGTVLDNIKLVTQHGLDADCVILDLDKTTQSIHPQHMQIVDMALGSFCKTCLGVKSLASETGSTNASWASQFVAMLSKHHSLHSALYHRLWSLIQDQYHALSPPHIHGLAVFLVQLKINQPLFPPLFITGADQQADGSLLNHIGRHLKHHTKTCMKFSLQFAADVIGYVVQGSDDKSAEEPVALIPVDVIKMFCYLLPRVYIELRLADIDGCDTTQLESQDNIWTSAVALYHTDKFQALHKKLPQLTLKEWVDFELVVEPHNDELTHIDRKDYYRWIIHSKYLNKPIQDGVSQGSYQQACTCILESLLDHDVKSTVYRQKSKRGLCCHGDSEGEDMRRTRGGCRSEIIQLLQELMPFLSSDQSVDTTSPWLLSVIKRKSDEFKEDERGCKEIYIICFMRLAYSLPAYLFFSTKPGGIPSRECVETAQQFVNEQLRVCEQDGAYGLSLVTTSYILRALLHIFVVNSSSTEACAFIQEILQLCPLVMASFLVHWTQLWPVIHTACGHMTPPLPFTQLNIIYQWAKSLLHHHGNLGNQTIEGSIQNADPWLLAVAMVAFIIENKKDGCKNKEEKMLRVVELVLSKDVPERVGSLAVECLIGHMSWNIIRFHKVENYESLSAIWKVPGVLDAFKDDTPVKRAVLRPCISRIYPVVFFRLMLNTRSIESKALSMSEQYIHTLLGMYAGLVELHCQLRLSSKEQDMETYSTPLSLDFHLACTRFVFNYLNRCSLELLQSLNQIDISMCDEDITTLIQKRLRNT